MELLQFKMPYQKIKFIINAFKLHQNQGTFQMTSHSVVQVSDEHCPFIDFRKKGEKFMLYPGGIIYTGQ